MALLDHRFARKVAWRLGFKVGPKSCCQRMVNLELRPEHPDARPGLSVRVCRVCGCRHFDLAAEPGSFGLRGSAT